VLIALGYVQLLRYNIQKRDGLTNKPTDMHRIPCTVRRICIAHRWVQAVIISAAYSFVELLCG